MRLVFKGIDAVAAVEEGCISPGFMNVGENQFFSPVAVLRQRGDCGKTGPEHSLRNYMDAVCERGAVRRGAPMPLGASDSAGGVNFALFSRHASRVRLELFARPADASPAQVIDLDPIRNRTGDVWHVWVAGLHAGQLYAYRVDGPYQPSEGHRFNFKKLLLDPFATAITALPDWDFAPARGYDAAALGHDLAGSL